MITTRSFQESDIPRISEIWEKYHTEAGSLPDRSSIITDLVVEKNDEVIGYGQLHHFSVAMMFMDLSIQKRDRREVIGLLLAEALRGASEAEIQKIYTFVMDDVYARLLGKHYGFDVLGHIGELLVREV